MKSLFSLKYVIAICIFLLTPITCNAFDYLQQLPNGPLVPTDNPLTDAKISLGKKLFFDPVLLGPHSKISCNSCHILSKGGGDPHPLSVGQNGKKTHRSTPTLWNIGLQTVLYWDGRSANLEDQTLDHLRDPVIATWSNIGEIITHLEKIPEYRHAFAVAFPGDYSLSGTNLSRAMASFERSLMAPNSAFDRYLAGDKNAISASAKRGIQKFNDVGCLACHFGVNFAGPAPGPAMKMGDGFYELFPTKLGSRFDKKYHLTDDLGRYSYTGLPNERFMWRVPPLRNIALTAPYFHNGSVSSLKEAVRVMARTQEGFNIPESTVNDISEFLKTLTGMTPKSIQDNHNHS
jgi:cytochrome c peroxidase